MNQQQLRSTLASYLDARLSALPANRKGKLPTVGTWTEYQQRLPTLNELSLARADGVCIICGAVSGNLELIDFDNGGELFDAWSKLVPSGLLVKLVIERSQSGGRHVVYRCESAVCGNTKLAQGEREDAAGELKLKALIETRGEGGLFLCHPTPGYELLQGELATVPTITAEERETLLSAAYSLTEHQPSPEAPRGLPSDARRPGDEFNESGDVAELLTRHGWKFSHVAADGRQHWTRPGKGDGTSGTLSEDQIFYCFSSNASPLDAGKAYSPFGLFALLEHSGDYSAAARALAGDGWGGKGNLVHVASPEAADILADPGPIPDELLSVPGFINAVRDYTLSMAPYPSVPLAFSGGLALQSFLAGRKVRDKGDVRPNVYLLALADSGSGKNAPRLVNERILYEAGLIERLGDSFASGPGLEDAMFDHKAMLFQADELDGMIQSINRAKDGKFENIMTTLLKLYSQAGGFYPMRHKAGMKAGVISQPHLMLFGTAIPKNFYEALSERMLTNGFVARMLIVESLAPRVGQDSSVLEIPPALLETAKWWAAQPAGDGNLSWEHPEPAIVGHTRDATARLAETRRMADGHYNRCQQRGDVPGMTIWARIADHARKLALLYAISDNHLAPEIQLAAADWASRFVEHQARRLLFMAAGHVAENPFDALCLKFLRIVRQAKPAPQTRTVVSRGMRVDAKTLDHVAETLIEQGRIIPATVPAAGPGPRPTAYLAL